MCKSVFLLELVCPHNGKEIQATFLFDIFCFLQGYFHFLGPTALS